MNLLRTSLKNNKKFLEILLFLFLFGFLIGFFLYMKFDNSKVLEEVQSISLYLDSTRIQYFSIHFLLLSVFITCSFTLIGIILFPLYFIFEGICIIYHILTFTSIFHLSGLFYSILFHIFIKGFYLFLMIFLFKTILNIVKIVILRLKNVEEEQSTIFLAKYIRRIVFLILCVLLNDLFIYFLGNKILCWFLFIIQ